MPDFNNKNLKTGLTQQEADEKLLEFGYNELPSSKPKTIFHILLDVLKEPMFLLLVACGSIYLVIGDMGEGLMLLASVFIIIGITFYQEKKTERALEALHDLSSPRALVRRDGIEKRIPGREVVPGDIIILQEGDRVAADAAIIETQHLKSDESLITGESISVVKSVWDGKQEKCPPAGDKLPFVYSGTLIVSGHGSAKVLDTGLNTNIGKIGKSLSILVDEPTLLQLQTRKIVKTFTVVGFSLSLVLILVFGFTRNDWTGGILEGLSLAMAMLPEEFAVVLTIFMAMGAWRISKYNVLTRKPASIETLGAVTVLCTDKTGTLTENKMTVSRLFSNGKIYEKVDFEKNNSDETIKLILESGILAGQLIPFDPMEKAIEKATTNFYGDKKNDIQDIEFIQEYPLTSQLSAMSRVYKRKGGKDFLIYSKGSPEAILALCKVSENELFSITKQIDLFAQDGLRMLGVAKSKFSNDHLPTEQNEFQFEFLGLIAFEDPLRESVPENLQHCYLAGVRVIMITGDYPITATSIAKKMGLKNHDTVLTGSEMRELNEVQLGEKIKTVNVFARVLPEQKLRLVQALKSQGEIVAMTGDGVNDAPALKAANIGIAREAAGIVLVNDDFSSIIAAIRVGRRIYDNIQKAMGYIFSVHIPIAGLTMISVFFPSIPMIMFPLHIAFLELIIDPASSLIFEAETEEKNIMSRPPRNAKQVAFGKPQIIITLIQGLFVLFVCLAVVLIGMKLNRPGNEIRSLAFTTLIIANLGLILINRSWTRTIFETFNQKNNAVKFVVGGAICFLGLVLFLPVMQSLFHFDKLHLDDLLICLSAGIISIVWFEALKIIKRKSRTLRS